VEVAALVKAASKAVAVKPKATKLIPHCHILEHEDHDMMRPFLVVPKGIKALMHGLGGHGH
jgi:FtsP/CotA-like multicopper oxidase with cupredoxin domain